MSRWEEAESLAEEGFIGTQPEKQKVYTVFELNKLVKKHINAVPEFAHIAVSGEISNYRPHYSGHMYITLKDEDASVEAICFKWSAGKLKFEPENGMKVVAYGKLDVYEKGGKYSLHIEDMEPEGVGSLQIAYEQLKKKLEEKGYFSDAHKKPIPEFPKKIGVVTSPTGAVIQDITNVIARRFPACEIVLYPAKVQGTGGELEVAAGINYFNSRDDIDTLIIGRGGGSMEDLWCFNEEVVADAIYDSKLPIISSVGHETDFTIADFVADRRAPTPSAAAEIATPDSVELKNLIITNYKRMLSALRSNIENKKELLKRLQVKSPKDLINNYYIRLAYAQDMLVKIANANFNNNKEKLKLLAGKLDSLSPLAVISRGYSVATINGATIKDIKQVKIGQVLKTQVGGGKIVSKITELEEE